MKESIDDLKRQLERTKTTRKSRRKRQPRSSETNSDQYSGEMITPSGVTITNTATVRVPKPRTQNRVVPGCYGKVKTPHQAIQMAKADMRAQLIEKFTMHGAVVRRTNS